MLISVIIPTYNRAAMLQQTLDSLLQQDYPTFEVIVVDQTARHEPEIQVYLDDLVATEQIQLFRVKWASLPKARNYGVRRSRGQVILFLDDDVLLPPGFLQAHAQNFLERPQVGAVAGRVFDRMKLADSGGTLVIHQLPPEAMDPGIAWYYLDLVHTVTPQQVLSARGCNMSFRRELFEQYQLWFDERFRGSAVREEADFCLRIRKTGFIIWYDPAAHLTHLGAETGGCHDLSTRSLQYQLSFYHNHFWMGLKNLTPQQNLRFFLRLFDCHVLGHPPCCKSGSLLKIVTRFVFYLMGLAIALGTWGQAIREEA